MEYISVKDTAIKWGISQRLVQRYCADGRIFGAKKYGVAWMVPADAVKPEDSRRKNHNDAEADILKVTKTEILDKVEDDLIAEDKDLKCFNVELAYYRGEIDEAEAEALSTLSGPYNADTYIRCKFIIALCAMHKGDCSQWETVLRDLSDMDIKDEIINAIRENTIALLKVSIGDTHELPKWFVNCDWKLLPEKCKPQAGVGYVEYLSALGKSEGALAAARIMLNPSEGEGMLIPRLYLMLLSASFCHDLNNDDDARDYLVRSLELAIPNRLFGILAERKGGVDTLMKDVMLENGYEEQWQQVNAIYRRLRSGWMKMRNMLFGDIMSNDLTEREAEAIKYVRQGLSNSEIADRMGIKANTVKGYLNVAYEKLHINKRAELYTK